MKSTKTYPDNIFSDYWLQKTLKELEYTPPPKRFLPKETISILKILNDNSVVKEIKK